MLQSISSNRLRTTVAQENGKSFLYLIFDTFDPLRLHASTLKPEMVERAILIQDAEDRNRLYALLVPFKRHLAAMVPAGTFHLDPSHPHRQNLDAFRDWLDAHGIDKRELLFAEPDSYERITTQGVVRSTDFSSREEGETVQQFNTWRLDGGLSCISV